jgi:hypothetical protein
LGGEKDVEKKQVLIVNLRCPNCDAEISAEFEVEPKVVGSVTVQEEKV